MSHNLLFLVDIHFIIVLLRILQGVMEKIFSYTQVSCTNEIRIGEIIFPVVFLISRRDLSL
jgi:hypothetical protein